MSQPNLKDLPRRGSKPPKKLPLLIGRAITPYRDHERLVRKETGEEEWSYAIHPKIQPGPRKFATEGNRVGAAHSWVCDRFRTPPGHFLETELIDPSESRVRLTLLVHGWEMFASGANIKFDGTMVRHATISLKAYSVVSGSTRDLISADKAKETQRKQAPKRRVGEPVLRYIPMLDLEQREWLHARKLDDSAVLCPFWMFPGSILVVNALTGTIWRFG